MHNPEDRSFIGHPRGLGYLAFTEAWERFSYYGMQSLLVLYMVNRLLHPGTSSTSPQSLAFAAPITAIGTYLFRWSSRNRIRLS